MVARRRADRVITRAAVANKLRKIAVERSNAVSRNNNAPEIRARPSIYSEKRLTIKEPRFCSPFPNDVVNS